MTRMLGFLGAVCAIAAAGKAATATNANIPARARFIVLRLLRGWAPG